MTPTARGPLRLVLAVTTAVVSLAGLTVEVLHHTRAGFESPLVPLLSLSEEANVPTWYSSSLLLACGVMLLVIAGTVRQAGGAFAGRWRFLGLVFLYLSLDESAQLHERLNGLITLRGAFYFSWIIPVGVLLVPLGLAYLRFLARLPAPTRVRFVLAGTLYVTGALLMEIPLGLWTVRHGEDTLGYVLIDWVEETLEMAGAAAFLAALHRHHGALSRPERAPA